MNKRTLLSLCAALLLCAASPAWLLADGHGKNRDRRSECGTLPRNAAYDESCGGCHFAYQPWLLPSGSWKAVLAGLDDHFGNPVVLPDDRRAELAAYLEANAADRFPSRRAENIMRGLGSATPARITDVPYILHKHHELDDAVLKRPSVGGLANCPACHTTAAQGVYDDDNVIIPR